MLTTKFFFSDQDKATKVASQMASAACKAKGFGEQDGVRIFPYIKEDNNQYIAQMEVGPDTPEYNMWVDVPMDALPDKTSVTISDSNGEVTS